MVLQGLYEVPVIEQASAMCKANALPSYSAFSPPFPFLAAVMLTECCTLDHTWFGTEYATGSAARISVADSKVMPGIELMASCL